MSMGGGGVVLLLGVVVVDRLGAALISLWPPRREDQASWEGRLWGLKSQRAVRRPDEEWSLPGRESVRRADW